MAFLRDNLQYLCTHMCALAICDDVVRNAVKMYVFGSVLCFALLCYTCVCFNIARQTAERVFCDVVVVAAVAR